MGVYADVIKYEAYVTAGWVDITADVVQDEQCKYGILSSEQTERVASPGQMKITLRNDTGCIGGVAGYYNPGFAGALSGWTIKTPIRQTITYNSTSFIKRWYVDYIDPGEVFNPFLKVSCIDFMGFVSMESIILPAVEFDVGIEDAAASILAAMVESPEDTTYGTGSTVFDTMFDIVSVNAAPLTELAKIALSEFGYVYVRREEDFTVEGKTTRVIADEITYIVNPEDEYLLLEDGDFLLQETGDKILLDDRIEASIDDLMTSADVSYGSNIKNKISITSYPRRVDAAATTVLFNLETSISLPAGETKVYRARYTDPSNEAEKVAGTSMVTPAATTHYLMNANADGSGANLTAALDVTADYYSQEVEYTLENTGGTNGYVTFLKAVGKGIYTYSPVEYVTEDSTSQSAYGKKASSIKMKYQSNPDDVIGIADKLLAQDKDPRIVLNSLSYTANYSATTMTMFVMLDVGDLINVVESTSGINGNYYIQSVEYTIKKGGLIKVTYKVIEALSFGEVYWQLDEVGFSELDETTYLGY